MSMFVSPPDTLMAQQMESQLTIYLRESLSSQPMADPDRWLYSVWDGQPDWMRLQNLLAGTGSHLIATALPVLLGCLHCCRRITLTSPQAGLLARQRELAYQQIIDLFRQGKPGILNGGALVFTTLF
ncbi:hypothetical protein [Spirosoma sp. KNUC1025]|uniref:hypothetical protein n=1 Tax=Spirosoma sp. KNUC1025 TaxID=2894082 RepID=UPI003863EFEE|nr:hypothetical protein LN737_02660 [Spirosoma sp. KNUC1025]